MSNLTRTRLEAIIEAIGQRLACASETDISREEYEKARDWAQGQLDRRRKPAATAMRTACEPQP